MRQKRGDFRVDGAHHIVDEVAIAALLFVLFAMRGPIDRGDIHLVRQLQDVAKKQAIE